MQSGSPFPIGDITHGQKYYDFIVNETGGAGASDALQSLRELPYDKFKAAIDDAPSIFSYKVRGVALSSNSALNVTASC